MEDFQHIPIIDIGAFFNGTPEEQHKVAKEISTVCEKVGFFYVINHGVKKELIDKIKVEMKNFFSLPYPEKEKINKKFSTNARGYFGIAEESLDNARDLKEGFDMGLDVKNPQNNPKLKGLDNYGENVWPDPTLVPNFRGVVEEYFASIFELGFVILKAFAIGLDLPPDYFDQFYRSSIPPMPVMRLLRYPPSSHGDKDQLGCGAHSDYGFLTILYQDGIGGLEVKNSKGEWIKAVPLENSFVINIGILLAQLTNDVYPFIIFSAYCLHSLIL
eukprot:TRINITY_DN3669_c0_g1_i3.p1 TRINITY_DN3669_c0_g1~~TRINITY_DN3669_c0_g1_i3.p1  ORF type:complete len:273 (-),score=56.64 TRINITY_DN3669_c0_g1_i3:594-1412(-)